LKILKNSGQVRGLKFLRLWLTLGLLLTGIIIFFSLFPSQPDTTVFSHSDKILHILAYGLLMYYFGCIYLPGLAYVKLGIGLIVLGFSLELIQGLIGYRTMEYWDMLANVTGVLIGWLLSKTRLSSILIYSENRLVLFKKDKDEKIDP
jgi:VanZ family protein